MAPLERAAVASLLVEVACVQAAERELAAITRGARAQPALAAASAARQVARGGGEAVPDRGGALRQGSGEG